MVPPKSDNWIRRFIVSDPRRHKKGFTIYKVTSIVSSSIASVVYNSANISFSACNLTMTIGCYLCVLCTVFKNHVCSQPNGRAVI